MTELPTGFYFQDVYCYQDGTSNRWTYFYIPSAPKAELNLAGQPIISLMASDRGAIVQLQTRWDVNFDVLSELKQELVRRYPELDPEFIFLELGQVSNVEVSLAIGDGDDKFQELQTANSSGVSPFSTIFNLRLTSTEKAKAISAFNGQKNYLIVKYKFSLEVVSTIETIIEGDIAVDVAQILSNHDKKSSILGNIFGKPKPHQQQKSVSLEECLTQIELALSKQRLHLRHIEINQISDQLRVKVDREAKENAAQQLLHLVKNRDSTAPNQSLLQVTARQTEKKRYYFEQTTDISSWFPTADGSEYIRFSSVPIDEPTREWP